MIALCIMAAVLITGGETQRFAVPCASAESGENTVLLDIKMSVQPAALVEPDEVTLSFTISNESYIDAQNLYLSSLDGLISESIGQIRAGESQTIVRQHSVTQDELDSGEIVYVISHNDPLQVDGKINYTVRAAISRSDAQPQAEFTRRFSARRVGEGDSVTITYCIRNTGNVVLNSLRVRDELGDFTGRIERLEVGESRTLVNRVTIREDSVSKAALSYGVEAYEDESHSVTLEDVQISVGGAELESRFNVGYSAFSNHTADVVLTLANSGGLAYRDICVIDDVYGGVIADGIEIPAGGDPVEISASCPLRGDGSFRWRVTGVCESGAALDFVTETLALEARSAERIADVTARVETQMPKIRRAGDVSMRVYIENAGDADIREIVLSESMLGDVHEFAVLDAGGHIEREIILNVPQDTVFHFSVSFTDAEGWQRVVDCAPVSVDIASDGVLPLGRKPAFIEFDGASIKIGGSSLFAVLLIVGVVVLAALIVMLLVASRRARIEKQLRQVVVRQKKRAANAKTAQERKKKA